MPAPIGTESHLCASNVIESARSIPARCGRSRGTSAVSTAVWLASEPPLAKVPSTSSVA